VKIALREENIPFEEVELSSNLELLRKIKEATGRSTVPQVFVGGRLIGGADETISLLMEGDFQMEVLKAGNTPPLPPDLMQALQQAREDQQVRNF
jgi:glutaredoxin 3